VTGWKDTVNRASERREILKQIRPEDHGTVGQWLLDGVFGTGDSREAREVSELSEHAARLAEQLGGLIRNWRELDATYNMLLGMDLESERLSET